MSMPIDSGIVAGLVLANLPSPTGDANAARIPHFASDPSISSGRARDHAERWP